MGTRSNRLNEAVRGGSNVYPRSMQKYENIKNNQLKIVIFTTVKNHCILDGRVFVMQIQAGTLLQSFCADCEVIYVFVTCL